MQSKARGYIRDGKERIIMEDSNSKRIYSVEEGKRVNRLDNVFSKVRSFFSQTMHVYDENNVSVGYYEISLYRRKIRYASKLVLQLKTPPNFHFRFFGTNDHNVATIAREDIRQTSLQQPTLDTFKFNIHNPQVFDPVLFVFAAGFSTITERRYYQYPFQKWFASIFGRFANRLKK